MDALDVSKRLEEKKRALTRTAKDTQTRLSLPERSPKKEGEKGALEKGPSEKEEEKTGSDQFSTTEPLSVLAKVLGVSDRNGPTQTEVVYSTSQTQRTIAEKGWSGGDEEGEALRRTAHYSFEAGDLQFSALLLSQMPSLVGRRHDVHSESQTWTVDVVGVVFLFFYYYFLSYLF